MGRLLQRPTAEKTQGILLAGSKRSLQGTHTPPAATTKKGIRCLPATIDLSSCDCCYHL